MLTLSQLKQAKPYEICVYGLGRSGLSIGNFLKKHDILFFAWDDNLKAQTEAKKHGFLLEPPLEIKNKIQEKPLILLSPGIPFKGIKCPHSLKLLIEKNGILSCDIELFSWLKTESTFIGITGTNGKSTTTQLIGDIFKNSEKKCEIGGNIGIPVFDLFDEETDLFCLELSSYHLELINRPFLDFCVLLNISEDHLDRYSSFNDYKETKFKLFSLLKEKAVGLYNDDDPYCTKLSKISFGKKTIIPFSIEKELKYGFFLDKETIKQTSPQIKNNQICLLPSNPNLMGKHNQCNIIAATAIASLNNLSDKIISQGLSNFKSLEHRLEFVGKYNNVSYINDSKGTNSAASSYALKTYRNIFWIAGGEFKEENFNHISPYLSHIKEAFLIGSSASKFADLLEEHKIKYYHCETLDRATKKAHFQAQKASFSHPTVLLSPCCSSFDQFPNFAVRGLDFKRYVYELNEKKEGKANGHKHR